MESWIETETQGVDLGDKRLDRRLRSILARLGAHPERSVALACAGGSEMHGAYRFFQNEAITPQRILSGHQAGTLERLRGQARVLCIGDSTFLNYPGQRETTGLGPHSSALEHGFILHPLVGFSVEGSCLGTMQWQSWARDPEMGKRKTRLLRPIEEKESRCWQQDVAALNHWRKVASDTELIYVADRESDIYELLAYPREPGVEFIIRAVRDRKTTKGSLLWAEAAQWPLAQSGREKVQVMARPGNPARWAELELRWGEVELAPPVRRDRRLPKLRLGVVWVKEVCAPSGSQPLEWMLLTSLPIAHITGAREVVAWYHQRWQIERFFFVLKQGCRVETLQLQTRSRLEAAISVYLIISYRIMALQAKAKLHPQAPALEVFNEQECLILAQLSTKPVSATELTLSEACKRLAQLGGYTARKSDGPPGPKTLWIGWQRLGDFIAGARFFAQLNKVV